MGLMPFLQICAMSSWHAYFGDQIFEDESQIHRYGVINVYDCLVDYELMI